MTQLSKHRWTWVFLALAVLASTIFGGCSGSTDEAAKVLSPPEDPEAALPVLGTLPEFTLYNEAGAPFEATHLDNNIWIASFIFTRCTSTCPLQTQQMKKIQDQMEGDPTFDPVKLLSLTVDPAYDTSEVLSAYARQFEADTKRWKFLTGPRETLWDLSKNGFMLAVGDNPPGESMMLFHSDKLILVDGQRRIRGFYQGTSDEGRAVLLADLTKLLAE